jgi:hypothetical protein
MGRLFGDSGWVFGTSGGLLSVAGTICSLRQARKCSDNSLAGLWISSNSLPKPFTSVYTVKRTSDGLCYYFDPADPCTTCDSTKTLIGTFTALSGCSDSACGTPGGGTCGTAAPCYGIRAVQNCFLTLASLTQCPCGDPVSVWNVNGNYCLTPTCVSVGCGPTYTNLTTWSYLEPSPAGNYYVANGDLGGCTPDPSTILVNQLQISLTTYSTVDGNNCRTNGSECLTPTTATWYLGVVAINSSGTGNSTLLFENWGCHTGVDAIPNGPPGIGATTNAWGCPDFSMSNDLISTYCGGPNQPRAGAYGGTAVGTFGGC